MKELSTPAYFINLDRHPERRDATVAQLEALGTGFTRIAGIDYRDLDAETIKRAVDPAPALPFKRALSPGEVACFLSHVKVWRLIAQGPAEMAFVFEDDVAFAAGAREALIALENGPRDWDMVRLFSPRSVPAVDVRPLHGRFVSVLSRKYPMSTIAYAITRPAAAHLAQVMVPFALPVDMALKLWWVHGLCNRIVVPSPCGPRTDPFSASTLDSSREAHNPTSLAARFVANLRYQIAVAWMRSLHARDFPSRSRLP